MAKYEKKFNEVKGSELKSIVIVDNPAAPDVKRLVMRLDGTDHDIYVTWLTLTYIGCVSPGYYDFKYEMNKDTLKGEKFMKNIRDAIARSLKLYNVNNALKYKKSLDKQSYLKMIKDPINIKKKTIRIRLYDTKIPRKDNTKMTVLGTKIYQIGGDGKKIYKEQIKASEFDTKYKVGTRFIPILNFDNIKLRPDSITINFTPSSMQIIGTPDVKAPPKDDEYIPSDEEDTEYDETTNIQEEEPKKEEPKKEEPKKEELKKEEPKTEEPKKE